jgi:signal peptide peptidase SppA
MTDKHDSKPTEERPEGRAFRFAEDLRGAPWALQSDAMGIVASPLAAPMRGARGAGARSGAIAILPMSGVLTPGGYYDGGDTSTDAFAAALMDVINDDTVGAVLLDINSPGGSVYGTGELADLIYSARKAKPVIGLANSLAASAAYWTGSQCTEFYCTPGGEVGSIGVYTMHMDMSGLMNAMGMKATLISAGKFKTEGNPFEPLTDEARAAIQASVDGYYAAFTQAVARGRNAPVASVRDGMGQGRVLGAKDALAAGMIDGIATRADVLRGMARKLKGAQGSVAELIAMEDVPEPEPVAQPDFAALESARARAHAARARELDILSL